MITALIIMHFFGGGSIEVFSRSDFKTVDRTIADVERAEAVTQAMERMNERLLELFEIRSEQIEELSDIDHEVNSRESAYDKILDELWKARAEARQKYIDDVFVMRENMTRDEWAAAFGIPDK